jgi:adenylate kinase
MNHIVLIGAPGVGKGTFSSLIQAKTGWKHLSVGDCLRQEVRDGSEVGNKVAQILKNGGLVSDSLADKIAFKHLHHINTNYIQSTSESLIKEWGRGVILDGYPRTVQQAEGLISNVTNTADTSDYAFAAIQIVLEPWVAIEKIMNRRQCANCGKDFNTADIITDEFDMPAILPIPSTCPLGPTKCKPDLSISRNDDTADTITRRMLEYEAKTAPVIEYFQSRGELSVFHVKKGVKDTPRLLDVISQQLHGR